MRPLRIWTPVWGHKHVKLLSDALAQSFLWPKNHEAIRHAKWSLFIHHSEFDQVMTAVTKVLPESQIETIEAKESLEMLTAQRGVLMCRALIQEIKKCLMDNHQFLISTPDFIWADGALASLRILGDQPGVCVAVPHPRVVPSILPSLSVPQTNTRLVSLSRQHAHVAWTSSEVGQNPTGSHKGGILWRDMSPGVTCLQHRMPSPYLVNFTTDDLGFFSTQTDHFQAAFGSWDHQWSDKLIEQQRWRMLLSSDLGFMCEVTDANQNVPPKVPATPNDPDSFWHADLNFAMNRQYVATFRSDV
jgi:hypothetical protein